MKKELSDVKETVHQKEDDLRKLKAKLEINESELNQAESALNQTMKDLKLHQDKLKKLQDEADNRVGHFEQLIARLQVFSFAKFQNILRYILTFCLFCKKKKEKKERNCTANIMILFCVFVDQNTRAGRRSS